MFGTGHVADTQEAAHGEQRRNWIISHSWHLWKGQTVPSRAAGIPKQGAGRTISWGPGVWEGTVLWGPFHWVVSGPRVDGGRVFTAWSTEGGRRRLMETTEEPLVLCNHICLLHCLLEAPSVEMLKGLILGTTIYPWIRKSLETFLCFAIWIHNTITRLETFFFSCFHNCPRWW